MKQGGGSNAYGRHASERDCAHGTSSPIDPGL